MLMNGSTAIFYGNQRSLSALKEIIHEVNHSMALPRDIDPECKKNQFIIFTPRGESPFSHIWNIVNLPRYGMRIDYLRDTDDISTVFLTVEDIGATLDFVEQIIRKKPSVLRIYLLSDVRYDVPPHGIVRTIIYSELKDAILESIALERPS